MINYVMIGTNRFEAAVAFYDAIMSAMGATRAYATEKNVGWGWGIGTPMLIVTRPFDQRQATAVADEAARRQSLLDVEATAQM